MKMGSVDVGWEPKPHCFYIPVAETFGMLQTPWLGLLAGLGDSRTDSAAQQDSLLSTTQNLLLKCCYAFFQTKTFGSGWDEQVAPCSPGKFKNYGEKAHFSSLLLRVKLVFRRILVQELHFPAGSVNVWALPAGEHHFSTRPAPVLGSSLDALAMLGCCSSRAGMRFPVTPGNSSHSSVRGVQGCSASHFPSWHICTSMGSSEPQAQLRKSWLCSPQNSRESLGWDLCC